MEVYFPLVKDMHKPSSKIFFSPPILVNQVGLDGTNRQA